MLCYAACPQYGLDSKFTGPGVLALLHRYNADSRDGGREQRMELVNAEEGVWSCTAVGYCSEVCPKGVDPANAVNQNKVNSAKDYFLRFLRPKGAASEPLETRLSAAADPTCARWRAGGAGTRSSCAT